MIGKKELLGIILAVMALALFSAAYAASVSFEIADYYGPNEIMSGIVEINVTNEPADSNLTAIFSGKESKTYSAKIIDILNNASASYSCNPADCSDVYAVSSPSSAKNASAGQIIALSIPSGKGIQITGISFNITGNYNVLGCGIVPAKIDLLNDNSIDWQYMEPSDIFCNTLMPAPTYNASQASADYNIVTEPYCEKITLNTSSKKWRLGADISKGNLPIKLYMSINDLANQRSEECELPLANGFQVCVVNFTVPEPKEYYICIKSDSDESDTMIKGDVTGKSCGKFGLEEFDCNESSIDYALYTQPSFFKPFVSKVTFNSAAFEDFSNQGLESYVQSYLAAKYNNDCTKGCAIPIKIVSGQDLVFSDLNFKYSSTLGAKTEKNFYSAERNAAKINFSGAVYLESAKILTPSKYGDYKLKMLFAGKEILSKDITIEEVPDIQGITPELAFAATETRFSVIADSPKGNQIVSYFWDFGDGETTETAEAFASHIYNIGNYTLKLTVTDSEGLSASKSFMIIVKEPKEIVNITIAKKRENLVKLKTALSALPSWYSGIVRKTIDIGSIEASLAQFESDSRKADADYVTLKYNLDSLTVPSEIKSESFETPLHQDVKADYIRELSGEDIADDELIKAGEKATIWQNSNLKITAFYSVRTAHEGGSAVPLATEYRLEIQSKAPIGDVYLAIVPPVQKNDTAFKSAYSEEGKKEVKDGFGFKLSLNGSSTKTIEFAVPGNKKPDDFRIFASAALSRLTFGEEVVCGDDVCDREMGESYETCSADCPKPYGKAITWIIIILIVLGGGIFAIWKYYAAIYDKKLREQLFKPASDFYKLTFFIANQKNKGKTNSEIKEELAKAGWKNSQIDYGLKKVKEQTNKIHKQSILGFVRREIMLGKSDEQIRDELKKGGWSQSLIDYGIREARKGKK